MAVARVPPPSRIAQLLDLSDSGPTAIVRTLTLRAGDTLAQVAESYASAEVFGGSAIEDATAQPAGMLELMIALGRAPSRICDSVVGRPAEPSEANALGINLEQHVYVVEHIGRAVGGAAVEATILKMPQHLWVLESVSAM